MARKQTVASIDKWLQSAKSIDDAITCIELRGSQFVEINSVLVALKLRRSDDYDSGKPDYWIDLEAINENDLQNWTIILKQITSPILTARLGDLLWSHPASRKTAHCFVCNSIDSNLLLAQRWIASDNKQSQWDARLSLQRALELAQEINESDRTKSAIESIYSACEKALQTTDAPGVSLRYLELLVDLNPNFRPSNVSTLVCKAKAIFANNVEILDQILIIDRRLVSNSPNEITRVDHERANNWLQAADQNLGNAIAVVYLERAAKIAQNYPLIRAAVYEAQRASRSDNEQAIINNSMAPIQIRMRRPRFEKIESAMNWTTLFNEILSMGPPTGIFSENEKTRPGLLESLGTSASLDVATGMISGEINNVEQGLRQAEMDNFQFCFECALVPAIENAIKKETFSLEGLNDYICNALKPGPDRIKSNSLLVAIWEWRGNQFPLGVAAALSALIEALMRDFAEQNGIIVLDRPKPNSRGGTRSIHDLISDLKNKMDESWRRYLLFSLVEDYGLNLRNNLSHGNLLDPQRIDIIALIIVVIFLLDQIK